MPSGTTLAAPVQQQREPLFTRPLNLLFAAIFFGWTAEGMVLPAVPLLILDRGGDGVLVGLVAICYAIPTLFLRPTIGRRIDRSGHGALHRLGSTLTTFAPLGYLAPIPLAIPLTRLVHGTGWALFGTTSNVVLARFAPKARRGEASSYFNGMYGAAFLVGPAVGVTLYTQVGQAAPFLAASATAAVALGLVTLLARERPPASEETRGTGAASAGPPPRRAERIVGRFLEPSAIPMMVLVATFMASQALFMPFAPVFARKIGEPESTLALYYPTYATVLLVGQLVTARFSDRVGHRTSIVVAISLAVVGLLIAILPGRILTFAIAGVVVAASTTILLPAASAAAMDRALPGRLGVAMATFSMGYQIATGLGQALWGTTVELAGYPWPFVVAIGLQLLALFVGIRWVTNPRMHQHPARAPVVASDGPPD